MRMTSLPLVVALAALAQPLTGCTPVRLSADNFESRYMTALTTPLAMRFWVSPDAYARLPDVEPHPCGGTTTKIYAAIPSFRAGDGMSTSSALELNVSETSSIAQWSLPVEAEPLQVAGDWLLVDLHDHGPERYWISRSGAIRRAVNTPVDWPAATGRACRAGSTPFDSWCLPMIDRLDQRPRVIAAETVCS